MFTDEQRAVLCMALKIYKRGAELGADHGRTDTETPDAHLRVNELTRIAEIAGDLLVWAEVVDRW